jgi:hypothetical protein
LGCLSFVGVRLRGGKCVEQRLFACKQPLTRQCLLSGGCGFGVFVFCGSVLARGRCAAQRLFVCKQPPTRQCLLSGGCGFGCLSFVGVCLQARASEQRLFACKQPPTRQCLLSGGCGVGVFVFCGSLLASEGLGAKAVRLQAASHKAVLVEWRVRIWGVCLLWELACKRGAFVCKQALWVTGR